MNTTAYVHHYVLVHLRIYELKLLNFYIRNMNLYKSLLLRFNSSKVMFKHASQLYVKLNVTIMKGYQTQHCYEATRHVSSEIRLNEQALSPTIPSLATSRRY